MLFSPPPSVSSVSFPLSKHVNFISYTFVNPSSLHFFPSITSLCFWRRPPLPDVKLPLISCTAHSALAGSPIWIKTELRVCNHEYPLGCNVIKIQPTPTNAQPKHRPDCEFCSLTLWPRTDAWFRRAGSYVHEQSHFSKILYPVSTRPYIEALRGAAIQVLHPPALPPTPTDEYTMKRSRSLHM